MNAAVLLIHLTASAFSASLLFAQDDIPSSPRSRDAISRVRPALEKELSDSSLAFGSPMYVRIFKEEMELEIWLRSEDRFRLFRTYPICSYGNGGLGPKMREGDGMAPEGFYSVPPLALNPVSRFHLSFNLGYPNTYDNHHERTGSALMVHGRCVSIGCYAMTDSIIEEVYALADAAIGNGQLSFSVHIFPFRMNDENMHRHEESDWYDFWANLKEGYDAFAAGGWIPPDVEVRDGRYSFVEPAAPAVEGQ